ncbi:MAG: ATP-dependent Clp protease adaptor ClpS [Desulfomonilaceae bacterium]
MDPRVREFSAERSTLYRDASVPVLFYTSRRLPHVSGSGKSDEHDSQDAEALYEVRIIDNDHNTYQEVMQITMVALGVQQEQAFAIAWDVDHLGSCVVAHAPKAEAEDMASLIRTIGIEVQVNPINESAC